jgi:hypothetical protein
MGKRQTKQTYGAVVDDQNKAIGESQGQQGVDTAQREGTDNQVRERGGGLENAYAGLEGGVPQTTAHTVSNARFEPIMAGYKDFADTGGWDSASRDKVGTNVDTLTQLGKTGGLDSEAANRFRGLGVYDEFAKTGGYSSGDLANIKAQALSPISSAYSSMKGELDRRRSVQGGYAPGFDASSRALRRDTARGIADTSLNANVQLKDRVNQGRMWGAQGASESENAYQGMRTGNMLEGAQAGGNMQINLQDNINRYRMQGLNGEQATAAAMADTDKFNAGAQTNTDQFNTGNTLDARYRALAGNEHLYDTSVNQNESARNRELGDMNNRNQTNLGYYDRRTPLATQPGIGGNIMRGIGGIAGAVAPVLNSGMGGTGWNFPGQRAPV